MTEKWAHQNLRDFLDKLSIEEKAAQTRLQYDNVGLGLRVAINELDWQSYNIFRCTEQSQELQEKFYIISLGLTRLIALMLTFHEEFTLPNITIRRQKSPFRKVLEVASHLGFIQHGRRMTEAVRAGICQINRPEDNRFEFILPEQIVDDEGLERTIEEHWKKEHERLFREELTNTAEGKRHSYTVQSLLEENVFVFAEHFMGYDADPVLDEYYFTLAWTDLTRASGYDSFNELKTFGGIPFLKYLLSVAYVNSLCLKHEGFCEAMTKKDTGILLEDILTISSEREPFIEDLRDALNQMGFHFASYKTTTLEEAWQIYEVLALTRRNVSILDRPWAPLPCIIEFSDSSVMKLCSGHFTQMDFLLRSLRHYYPQDYDIHQQSREGSMQRALKALLKTNFDNVEIRMNTRLRNNGRMLTDVDFTMIDTNYGEIFLFQLKHQDRHGADIKSGFSKTTRFREESVRWISTINQWIDSRGEVDVKKTFQVPGHVKIKKIRKIVIARYHAHPLTTVELDDDTAYANWIQLINAVEVMKSKQGDFRTPGGLFNLLRQYIVGAEKAYHYDIEPVEYCLDALKFVVRQDFTGNKQAVSF